MIPVCSRCDRDIKSNNHRWPGYCSTLCKQADALDRDRALADLAKRRRERAELEQTQAVLT